MSYTTELNIKAFLFLSTMKPSEIGETPIKGDWVSNYIINDYFPPEISFSAGDNIVLNLEIADLIDLDDYTVQCFSIHAPNNTLTDGLWFSNWNRGTEGFAEQWGINVTIVDNDSQTGTTRLIQITVSNATEKHVGFYNCLHRVRLTEYDVYPSIYTVTTGTKLSMGGEMEWPTWISYEVGNNLLGYNDIDDEAMLEEGYPNVFQCIVTAWEPPNNVSLYFQDEHIRLSGPFVPGWPSYNSLAYKYRFAEVSPADEGMYMWVIEIGDQVIEKEIHIRVATV